MLSSAHAVKTIQSPVADIDTLLGSREVVCTIEFAAGSTSLSAEAEAILDSVASRIKATDLNTKMIRIEGFSSPEGDKTKNFRLSIDRARAVERFLRVNHGVSLEHYISGFGSSAPEGVSASGKRSVQIAIYDNPWGQEDIPVDSNGDK